MRPDENADVLQMREPAGAHAPDPFDDQLGLRRAVIEERRARVHHERTVGGQADMCAEVGARRVTAAG